MVVGERKEKTQKKVSMGTDIFVFFLNSVSVFCMFFAYIYICLCISSKGASKGAGKGGMAAVQMLNDAVRNDNIQFAKELLQSGTNACPMGAKQETALHIACSNNSIECCALLLKFECSVAVQNVNGDTALHLCGKVGAYECAEALIRAGASKIVKNNSSETPCELAKNELIHIPNPNQNFQRTLELLS